MPDPKQPKVTTGNVFTFSNGALSSVAATGTLQTNLDIAVGAAARARAGTNEVLSDGPSAVVVGVEKGAASAVENLPKTAGVAGKVVPGAAILSGVNDTINVGQHAMQGNGAEAVTEGLGVMGQASGAYAGGEALGGIGFSVGGPIGGVLGTGIGAGLGAYFGADGWKKIGTALTGGDTPDKVGPPQTLPNDAVLQPTITTAAGDKYALVQVDGKYTWFAMLDNSSLTHPNQYVEVTRGAKVAELTQTYLKASGYEQQIAEQHSQLAQDAFVKAEILYRNQNEAPSHNISNGLAPDGSKLNQAQTSADGSTSIWVRHSETGNLVRVTNSPRDNTGVETHYDKDTGKVLGGTIYQKDANGEVKQIPFGNATGATPAADGQASITIPAEPFTPLPNSGTPGTSFTIRPGDSLWKIGKTLGMSDAETARFVDETQASSGTNADVNDLRIGNTVAIPGWALDKLTAYNEASINGLDLPLDPSAVSVTHSDPSDARFSRYPATSGASADNDTTPQPPPITEPSATYDPSDHHFNNYEPPTPTDLHPLTQDLGLASTLIGLKNWHQQTDLGKLGTAVGLYNTLNTYGLSSEALASGATNNLGLGSLSTFGSGLGLVQALQSGNPISIASSGGSFYNSMAGSMGMTQISIPVLNALNIAGALQSGNPLSIASSVAACFPPYGTVISLCLSVFGGLLGNNAPPPPPDGLVSYQLGEDGSIQIQTEHNVSGGADSATSTAGSLLGILQSVIDANNDQAPGDASTQLAIDPSRLPQVGFTAGTSWIAITQADGSTTKETVHPENIGQRLIELATQNDAIVPQWHVQTLLAHQQTHSAEQKAQAQDNAEAATTAQGPGTWEGDASTPTATSTANPATPNADDFAPARPSSTTPSTTPRLDASAVGIQGQALESADHKTQTVGALIVHLDTPEAQAHISALAQLKPPSEDSPNQAQATSEVYRDVDGDGFLESTQWVSTLDAQGNAQGLLVLDANANGQIETADILHLGGNSAERNSLAWLDANGDGKLDASDPAFSAIKLWVDVNQNGRMDAAENTTLQSLQLTSIDLQAGSLTYSNGHSETLTATTLAADTEGVQLGTVYGVGEDGQLQDLKAGELLVYEHYDGKARSISTTIAIAVGDGPAGVRQTTPPVHYQFHSCSVIFHGGYNRIMHSRSTRTLRQGPIRLRVKQGKRQVQCACGMALRITGRCPSGTATMGVPSK